MTKKRPEKRRGQQEDLATERIDAITRMLDRMVMEKPYRGKLSPKQIAEGINAANENANRLVKDAEILFEVERYPSATALAVLAIEETGKGPILRALATAKTAESVRNAWKEYRSHQAKNVLWLFPLYALAGVRTLSGFAPLFDPKSKHQQRADELKQAGFYTDCVIEGKWTRPEGFVDAKIAEFIITTAKSLTKQYSITEREVELWIEHVGGDQTNAASLKKFWDAMTAEGLAQANIEHIDRFLGFEMKR